MPGGQVLAQEKENSSDVFVCLQRHGRIETRNRTRRFPSTAAFRFTTRRVRPTAFDEQILLRTGDSDTLCKHLYILLYRSYDTRCSHL